MSLVDVERELESHRRKSGGGRNTLRTRTPPQVRAYGWLFASGVGPRPTDVFGARLATTSSCALPVRGGLYHLCTRPVEVQSFRDDRGMLAEVRAVRALAEGTRVARRNLTILFLAALSAGCSGGNDGGGSPSAEASAESPAASPSPVKESESPATRDFSVVIDGITIEGHCSGTEGRGPTVILTHGNGGSEDSALRGRGAHG